MVSHTPAPWVIIPAVPYDGDDEALEGSYTSPAGIEGDDGNAVCVFGTLEGSGFLFENEADYRLIAAAPELLAALSGAIDILGIAESNASGNPEWDYVGPRVAACRAAIAKAVAA